MSDESPATEMPRTLSVAQAAKDEGVIKWGRIYSDLVQESGDIDAQIEQMTKG